VAELGRRNAVAAAEPFEDPPAVATAFDAADTGGGGGSDVVVDAVTGLLIYIGFNINNFNLLYFKSLTR
jgi:hypothetical protein